MDGPDNYGNTPTRVGRTAEASLIEDVYKKHPHSRGEDSPVMI